ncbi:uncharacterized mitochondrial protein AtMg00810-like [Humulus lupulus]|uniref:uncharacterized mitochondrial protein AtMg00810-like n=1 Tax=Humulus lupulus TaxID=3486 RepID=UPI002B40865C|nr:uncharacterized mitochondrial protein AtMg00810-like [Humulus lupulus]
MALLHWGFTASKVYPSLFLYRTTSVMIIFLVYVDDIIVTGSCPQSFAQLFSFLRAWFSVKELGPLHFFLGNLSVHDGSPLADPTEYHSLIGALQYCTMTRPDLSFPVNQLCQFMHSPTTTHLQAVKHVLHYLKGTAHLGLLLQPSPNHTLYAYTDADWASCLDDRRSTSAYCIFLGHNLISWSFTKQKVVSRSRTDSEYRALANGAAELS